MGTGKYSVCPNCGNVAFDEEIDIKFNKIKEKDSYQSWCKECKNRCLKKEREKDLRVECSFETVGHGAFAVEVFKTEDSESVCTIVFDCGSKNKNLVEERIKTRFKEREVIDAIFISHLHDDHINGVSTLLKYCDVRRIYYPILTEEEKIQLFIDNRMTEGDENEFVLDFIREPFEAIQKLECNNIPELIGVRENSELVQNENEIISGKKVSLGIPQWIFVPYNFQRNDRAKELMELLKREFKTDFDISQMSEIWEDQEIRNRIKDCYDKLSGKRNENSMVVYSGEDTENMLLTMKQKVISYQTIDNWYAPEFVLNKIAAPAGCLYMGDYNAKNNTKFSALDKAYLPYWKGVGCVQIPHHGSDGNSGDEFLKKIFSLRSYYVINAKADDAKHPGISLVRLFMKNKRIFMWVTEEKETKFETSITH